MKFLENLLNLRNKINKIDQSILKILSKRKKTIKKIAKIKIKNNYNIKDIKREKELFKKIYIKSKKYKLNIKFIKKIFTCILKESVNIQNKILYKKKPKIFFLGPIGSYSYIATKKYFKKNILKFKLISCKNFNDTIKKNKYELCSYTILPIENSNTGYIKEVIDIIKNKNLFINNEINISIQHCLLAKKNTKIKDIKNIYSHVQPIKQTSKFITKFLHWKIHYTSSSTEAMKKIYNIKKNNSAAIGNKKSGKIYKLSILNENISNHKNNITRFIILSNKIKIIKENKNCKLTCIFKKKIKKHTLAKIFLILKNEKYNLLTINTTTIKNKKIKTFLIDIYINKHNKKLKKIINKIQIITKYFEILGLYSIS
ncbi:prephenate dehydratase domain-containing protein [Buchnera aphidicola (Mollitrichosiphum nigrofasciatum)]|uniref:prephenate dehydratase domain-containing protein n=1 Tax=Buchnera aphidicola TaxID=9 RepID=UPI0031B7F6A5